MDEFAKEVIERLVKLEGAVEVQTSTLKEYIALQTKHTEVDSLRLDKVEDEIDFWRKLAVRGSWILGILGTVVTVIFTIKK